MSEIDGEDSITIASSIDSSVGSDNEIIHTSDSDFGSTNSLMDTNEVGEVEVYTSRDESKWSKSIPANYFSATIPDSVDFSSEYGLFFLCVFVVCL